MFQMRFVPGIGLNTDILFIELNPSSAYDPCLNRLMNGLTTIKLTT